MLLKTELRSPALTAGLSVALFALLAGMSQAQDNEPVDPVGLTGDDVILVVDPTPGDGFCEDCADTGQDTVSIDPIEYMDGEPLNIDGIGDGEPLPDVVLDDEIGEVIGDYPEVTTQEFPESTCGGCEYQTMVGGPEVQRDLAGPGQAPRSDRSGVGATEVVSDETNICYNADLYIPLLCDWQRPFVGDKMP